MKSGLKDALLNAVTEVGWSHKIQEKQADRYREAYKCWTFVQLLSAGLTSTGAVTVLISDSIASKVATIVLGLLSFLSSGILKAWDFQNMAEKSKEYANQLFVLREKLTDALRDLAFDMKTEVELQNIWELLEKEPLGLAPYAIPTSEKAVKKASQQLKKRRDNIREDDYVLFISPEILDKLNVVQSWRKR